MIVKVNGEQYNTPIKTLYELKMDCGYNKNNIVTIINGYQTDENKILSENDTICFIEKGVMPDERQLKEMMRSRHTPGVYDAVKNARVAVAGLGGLGSNIAIMLARTGVGHIHLIDFDMVDASNLNRQQYGIKHLGMYKTDALKEELKEINPFLDITADCVKIDKDNANILLKNEDIICEAFDNPEAKAMLTDVVLSDTDKILVAASGMAGIGSSNTIITKKITDRFYICGDGVTAAQEGMGLMAPRVTICAAHQANMIIRLITGIKET